ncbi:hypothetical protein [Salinimicrobium xinjiangense]|uniref:hypothetical protein n=1 Tax=Salinimicrobium xinjiangense TaxID=438596 RepID=UPI000414336A|nr:hypothetical protein [Salinimicrobium xinjiangense]
MKRLKEFTHLELNASNIGYFLIFMGENNLLKRIPAQFLKACNEIHSSPTNPIQHEMNN